MTTPQKLLVLGGSLYQVPVIERAKRRGLHVVVADINAAAPGAKLADEFWPVSITDTTTVLDRAVAAHVDAVVAYASDAALWSLGALVDSLCVPGPSTAAIDALCDKANFRRLQASLGLPGPRFWLPDEAPASPRWVQDTTVVVKPTASSGSKGIRLARGAEITSAIHEARVESLRRRVIVEEALVGDHLTCEGILTQGKIRSSIMSDRLTMPPPFVTTTGHLVPSRVPQEAIGSAHEQIQKVFAQLSVPTTVFDADLIWTGTELVILEVTPRGGGNSMARVFQEATGCDLVDCALSLALGEAITMPRAMPTQCVGILLLGVEVEGTLKYSQPGTDWLRTQDWVRRLSFDVAVGTPVVPFVNGRHRIGECLFVAEDRDQLDVRAATVRDKLKVRVDGDD